MSEAWRPETMLGEGVILRFCVGTTELALPAAAVEEVLDASRPVPIPHAPPHLLGVVAVRSRALPLVALEALLALEQRGQHTPGTAGDDGARRRIIVTAAGDLSAGLLCDRLRGVHEMAEGAVHPPNGSLNATLASIAAGELLDPERGLVVLLDPAALLEAARVR